MNRGWVLLVALAICAPASASDIEQLSRRVSVKGSEAFREQTRRAMSRLQYTESGQRLLRAINVMSHDVVITEINEPNGYAIPASEAASRWGPNSMFAGTGSEVQIAWNPNFAPGDLPADVILGHELIHAFHMQAGIDDPRILSDPSHADHGTAYEELRTVGVEGFDGEGVTENSIRREWNEVFGTELPNRDTYASLHTPADARGEPVRKDAGGAATGDEAKARGLRGPPQADVVDGSGSRRGARGALEGSLR